MTSESRLRTIAAKSGGDFFTVPLATGAAWLSRSAATRQLTYEAEVPRGLHIGLGVAKMRTSAAGIGGFVASGPVFSVLQLASEPVQFQTTIDPGVSHSFGIHLDVDQMDGDVSTSVLRILDAMRTDSLRTVADGAILQRAIHVLTPIDPWFQGSARELILQARGYELLAIAEMWLHGAGRRPAAHRAFLKAEAVRDLIESQLAQTLTLDLIARSVGVNVRTLSTLFRERFGVGVAAFLTERRMQVATRMLCEGASVAEAAYAVGYQPNSFSTAFRRQFGVPPSALGGRRTRRPYPDREEEIRNGEGQ